MILLPTTPAAAKPLAGASCNGCGWCCTTKPCFISELFLGPTLGPCPALEFEEGRTWCGLVRRFERYVPALADDAPRIIEAMQYMLGMNHHAVGCDSIGPDDTAETRQDFLARYEDDHGGHSSKAMKNVAVVYAAAIYLRIHQETTP